MPGILPMKVIKVGTSAQSRIAQACDRCRSKKIRCDGFRPTCTQCANIGFECKTSDKLSRRAFPRGYTESLEERVRALEGEVRSLMDLLDEKEEKIEILSKMHSNTQPARRTSATVPSFCHANTNHQSDSFRQDRDSLFKIQQSPCLVSDDSADSCYAGNSSSRAFLLAFKRKLQESRKAPNDFDEETFFSVFRTSSSSALLPSPETVLWSTPSRVCSDQMVNVYFQEWAPLFPVLHRPSFLALYEEYVSSSNGIQDEKSLAQLNLVFGIAALSNKARISLNVDSCEHQWTTALNSFVKETSIVTLQCLVLAQLFHIQKGELDRVCHYKGLAVAMSQRLGLHLSQKRLSMGVLTIETRKKLFWSLYVIDCFSAALLGLPRMLREDIIFCEYPVDADDENVTERGFQPAVPGEYTKLSCALTLFRGCRIMSKVLDQNYTPASCHESSLRRIAVLDSELDEWQNSLPKHLKLIFVQDKPSTNVTSSRSPLLSLTYNFIRTLIHRPVVFADLGARATSSAVALAGAYKQIVQVVQLLDERSLSFSHCLDKDELLLMSGLGLLYHSLELDQGGKLMRDSQRVICSVIKMLEAMNAPGAAQFKQLGCSMLSIPSVARSSHSNQDLTTKKAKSVAEIPPKDIIGGHKQLAALAARFCMENNLTKSKNTRDQRKSMPLLPDSPAQPPPSQSSDKSLQPLKSSASSQSPALSLSGISDFMLASPRKTKSSRSPSERPSLINLDYYSFSGSQAVPKATDDDNKQDDASVWDEVLNKFKLESHNDPYFKNSSSESIHTWSEPQHMVSPSQTKAQDSQTDCEFDTAWTEEIWNYNLDLDGSAAPQSVLSLSDESFTSGEDFSSVDYGSSKSEDIFKAVSVPCGMEHFTPESLVDIEGLQ